MPDRTRELTRIDAISELALRLQYLQVAPRQKRAWLAGIGGVARELDGVFRCAERGCTDAFARGEHRPRGTLLGDRLPQCVAKSMPPVAELASFARVSVFAYAG